MTQLQIDFTGKKDKRITFAVDEDLENLLKKVAKKLGRDDVSCLAREYVIECVTRDMGKIMLLESRSDRRFVNIASL